MSRSDGRSRLLVVGVIVCCLTATAGVGSGTLLRIDEPSGGSGGDRTAQLSDRLFEEPSETVSEPELDVFLSDPTVEPGTETTVELTVLNTGSIESGSTLDDETATARGVSLSIDDDDAPVEVSPTETAVGSIPPGESVSIPVTVTAPASADGDDGELDIEIDYTYTEYDSDDATDESETDDFEVGIAVSSRARFSIDDVDTDTQVGASGTVDVEIENIGEEDAENARVSARSPTGGVTIGVANGATGVTTPEESAETTNGRDRESDSINNNGDESAAFIGDLDSDDDETVSFDTRIDSEVSVESYLLEATVVYEDEDGILRESTTIAAAVEPTAGQTFELSDPNSTLEVGDSGTITAELENTGPEDLDTPVVRAEPASDRIDIGESQVALDGLEEDESTNLSFAADVSGEAEPGPRAVTFTIEYGAGGDRLDSDPFVRRVVVRAEQPAFTISADTGEIPAGTTEPVALNITNNREETLSNINVFLYPDGPLSVDTDEAFIAELDPGESQQLAVDVSVDESADQRAYPLEVDVRYDDETDEDLLSQVYQVPITAGEPPDDNGWLPSFVSLVGLAVILGGAVLARRRR